MDRWTAKTTLITMKSARTSSAHCTMTFQYSLRRSMPMSATTKKAKPTGKPAEARETALA
eukprot:scaffold1224_cov191-Pinguiococcus_pyrenoidosus.AAC.12